MRRDVVVVVEPESGGVRHLQILGGAVQVEGFTTLPEGFTAYVALRPVAVLVSLQQRRGNGFQLTRALRQQAGPGLILIAYGRPTLQQRRTLLNESSTALQARWGFDRYLPREPSVADLDTLLRARLGGPPPETEETERADPTTAETQEAPATLRRQRLSTAQRDEHEVAARLSWGELLRTDLDGHTLRLLWLKLTGRRQAA